MRTPRHLDLPGIDIKSTLFDRLKELKGQATNKLKSLGNNRLGKGIFRGKGIFKGSCAYQGIRYTWCQYCVRAKDKKGLKRLQAFTSDWPSGSEQALSEGWGKIVSNLAKHWRSAVIQNQSARTKRVFSLLFFFLQTLKETLSKQQVTPKLMEHRFLHIPNNANFTKIVWEVTKHANSNSQQEAAKTNTGEEENLISRVATC